jgi:hypothetical protein
MIWNDMVTYQPGLSDDGVRVGILGFVAGVLVLGAIAGGLIGRHGSWPGLLVIAGIGAFCVFVTMDLQWSSDARACDPTAGDGCDLFMGFGAILVGSISSVLLLVGAATGRVLAIAPGAVAARVRARRVRSVGDT